jgi:ribonucleoside-diphosphate reductase beta chain
MPKKLNKKQLNNNSNSITENMNSLTDQVITYTNEATKLTDNKNNVSLRKTKLHNRKNIKMKKLKEDNARLLEENKKLVELVSKLRSVNEMREHLKVLENTEHIKSLIETKNTETKDKKTIVIIDPIFDPENSRDALLPIKFKDIWDMYLKAKATFWTDEEIDLADDLVDWVTFSDGERYFIKNILAFFAGSDFIVNENLKGNNFMDSITIMELEFFYRFQQTIEDIHSQAYANLLETFVKDDKEKETLQNAVKTIPVIKKKADWARKWIKEGSVIERIVAFSIVEGIFFSGSFCAIYWLKKNGKMPGLTHSNELISRDEGMHRDMACIIYQKYIYNKLDVSVVRKMVIEAVNIEKEFICESLPVKLIGMNNELMSKYIEYVSDHLTFNLINEQIYNTENPFEWMNLISMPSKANFFEKRVAEYAKQMTLSTNDSDDVVRFDAEF